MPDLSGTQNETRLPFAGATGRGVRVSVIDSGVNPRHPHIKCVAGGVSVEEADDESAGIDYTDLLGHGTAVTAAIQEKASDADCFAVKVFQRELRTSASILVRAIEWCIEQNMDVVNMSLGTSNGTHAERFARTAERAADAGVLLVAARDMDGQLCYPGCLRTVFSVGLDWDCPRTRYRCENQGAKTVFYASGYPRSIPGVPPRRNLHGTSFAVANMTGFIVRACEMENEHERGAGRVLSIRAALLRECAAHRSNMIG